jgi:SAM-dependent methyltransferase
MAEFRYVGQELDLFAAATRWKSYWSSQIRPLITGDVLEVGAGIGTNTPYLDHGGSGRWVCLEPDPDLYQRLLKNLAQRGGRHEARCGILQAVPRTETFGSILYIDVLEHIADDRSELEAAIRYLQPGGRVIVLAPAHQWLFSEFDEGVGHYRRYDAQMFRAISPKSAPLESIFYLDSVGLAASAANRVMLHQQVPSARQLRFWDAWLVRMSTYADPLIGRRIGKTIVAAWQRPSAGGTQHVRPSEAGPR